MKKIHNILSLALVLVTVYGITSCEKELEIEEFAGINVDFAYQSSSIHYVIGEEILFINKSLVGSSWEWHFGDGTTSTEKDPVHKYTIPATYTVKLIVDGGNYEVVKKLMVSDIVPVVTYTSSDPAIIYNQSEVSFDVKLLNPENLEVSYQWSFPEMTAGDGIDENFKSFEASPKVTFGTIGSQKVILTVTMGEKQLSPISVNVRVNYDKGVKTLYYAVKKGNLMARSIIHDDIDQSINKSFDLGYRSGKHPLNMQFVGDWCYVFDAGTSFTYVADPAGLGDGEIFAVAHDGSKREVVIENFGGDTYQDFYYGYIDQEENALYWADRREGIFKTSLDTRNRKFSFDEFNYLVRNTWLGYYGKGIYWGNVNGPITRLGDTYWWAKHSNGAGIFRFIDSDIKGEDVTPEEPAPASGVFVATQQVRGMVVDEINGHIYIASQTYKMILCYEISSGKLLKAVDRPRTDDGEGGDTESLFVTSMALDQDENGDGYLYWAYRGPAGTEDPNLKSGIKRFRLNDGTAVAEYFIEGVEAYSIAIDHQLR